MGLTPEEIDAIAADAEACKVPLQQLRYLAEFYLLPDEVDHLLKLGQTNARAPHLATAKELLIRLNDKQRGVNFAIKRYDKLDWAPQFRAAVGAILKAVCDREPAHQGLFGSRDLFRTSPEMDRLAQESAPRICCVVGEYAGGRTFGTGFLVGPNTIMTWMHIFDKPIAALGNDAIPDRFRAVFDCEDDPLPGIDDLATDQRLKTVKFERD